MSAVEREQRVPFFGIWHEAWSACLAAHNIERTPAEDARCSEAARESIYHPDRRELDGSTAEDQ